MAALAQGPLPNVTRSVEAGFPNIPFMQLRQGDPVGKKDHEGITGDIEGVVDRGHRKQEGL